MVSNSSQHSNGPGGSGSDWEGCITLGPWGSSKGKEWIYRPRGFIRTIIVNHGNYIKTIEFQTDGSEGETGRSIFGSTCGNSNRIDKINFDDPYEHLMSISGTFGGAVFTVVTSICFKTNRKCYGLYGTESGTVFSCDCKSGVIVGFHGLEYNYLAAIGVYVMPQSLAFDKGSTYEGRIKNEVCSSMPRMVMPRDAGPWGENGGKPWDDGFFATVKQVRVHLGELNVIYAIQFEYLKKDAKSVLSQIHGGTDGAKVEVVIDLDVEDEYLIGISGYYGLVEGHDGLEAITSISFHTNNTIHGPCGKERCAGHVFYSSTASSGKVAGFHGRDNGF